MSKDPFRDYIFAADAFFCACGDRLNVRWHRNTAPPVRDWAELVCLNEKKTVARRDLTVEEVALFAGVSIEEASRGKKI